LFRKLRWPDVGPVPCLVKPLTARALQHPNLPPLVGQLISSLAGPAVGLLARRSAVGEPIGATRHFDDRFTALWERVAAGFNLAVRRDAAYLNWKYIAPPHVRYSVAVLTRDAQPHGYAVYRHVREPRGQVTLLVDFLTDPQDATGFRSLVAFVDQEARAAGSDRIRTFVTHAAFRKVLRRSGYFPVKSTMEFVARINDIQVPDDFYRRRDNWHVTLGDSDQDR
jgi:hypothetical protein